MTIETLRNDMQSALKNGDKLRRGVIADMIAMIQRTATAGKTKIEVTEDFVNDTLIKYQKTIQEMIDTCPASRTDKLSEYTEQMTIVKEYAPQLSTDEGYIKALITGHIISTGIALTKANRGKIMKIIAPVMKGKADMKAVNKVIGEMLADIGKNQK